MPLRARKPKQPKAPWYIAKYGNGPQKVPRRRIRPVSAAMAKVLRIEAKLKREFLARPENQWCPVAQLILKRQIRTTDHHHTRGKKFPALRLAVQYWLAVSRYGHDWIHSNIEFARRLGWLCPKGEFNTLPKTHELS